MARLDGNAADQLIEQKGRKKLIKKISFTTSGARTDIGTTDIDSKPLPSPGEYSLVLQADQDFYYELRNAGATTAVTVAAGSRPGVFVPLKTQEVVVPLGAGAPEGPDGAIDVIGATASGNLSVFWVR